MRRITFIFLVFLAFTEFVDAQGFYTRRIDWHWMFSFGAGGSQYHGDLYDVTYDGFGPTVGPSLGVGMRKKIWISAFFKTRH